MTTDANIQAGFNATTAGINAVKALIGAGANPLTDFNGTATANLIAMLNEVLTIANNAASSGGAQIDDDSTNNVNTWSGSKIDSELTTRLQASIDALVDGAPEVKNTLSELIAFIDANEGSIVTMLAEQAKRVAVNKVQNFTAGEKAQGNANLGSVSKVEFGSLTTNYAATVNAGLV